MILAASRMNIFSSVSHVYEYGLSVQHSLLISETSSAVTTLLVIDLLLHYKTCMICLNAFVKSTSLDRLYAMKIYLLQGN